MANETPITLIGRLTEDPSLRFTPSGVAVVGLTIACNERRFNKQTNEFEDGTPVFWRASAWRDLAERVAATLQKGHAVVAYGFVEGQTWQDKETGKDRYGQQVQLQSIGPDLRWMEAQASKAQRQQPQQQPQAAGPDPWATQPGSGQQTQTWGGQQATPATDEPPF